MDWEAGTASGHTTRLPLLLRVNTSPELFLSYVSSSQSFSCQASPLPVTSERNCKVKECVGSLVVFSFRCPDPPGFWKVQISQKPAATPCSSWSLLGNTLSLVHSMEMAGTRMSFQNWLPPFNVKGSTLASFILFFLLEENTGCKFSFLLFWLMSNFANQQGGRTARRLQTSTPTPSDY